MAEQKTGVWIDWHGGDCPVPNGVDFLYKMRSTGSVTTNKSNHSYELDWMHNGTLHKNAEIIAYLIVPTYVPPAKPKRWVLLSGYNMTTGCRLYTFEDKKTGAVKKIPVNTIDGYVVLETIVNYLNEVEP